MQKSTLTEIVSQVNELAPDLVVITGDLADGSVGFLFDEITPLKSINAPKGIYFVTGNHEYYSGVEQWIKAIKDLGIIVLENRNIKIIGKNEENIALIGVNDHEGGRFGKQNAPDFKKAFKGVGKRDVKILLTHQPRDIEEASKYNVDLMLSGHTHGGQIWPFGYIVELQQKYLKGYYKYNNTHLYVNQGTGCWGPPMRLESENEITEVILI
jgi:predicted MPP superfamily phosphohydrolase